MLTCRSDAVQPPVSVVRRSPLPTVPCRLLAADVA